MPIARNLELHWVKVNPARPQRFENKATAPAKWSVQIRVYDKAQKAQLEKEFGFQFKPMEVDDKIVYKTTISRFAFQANRETGKEDTNSPNDPVNVMLADGTPIDPDTIGNGSVANISFYMKEDKSNRTLKGIQVTKLIKYEPRESDTEFELSDDYEIIEPNAAEDSPY